MTAALLAPATLGAGAAQADPVAGPPPASRTLQARADALRAQVQDLQLRQSVATEDYDTAVTEVQAAISAEVRAQAALDAADGASRTTRTDATRRVRSLYIGGATSTLGAQLSSVLAAGDLDGLDEAAAAVHVARAVVGEDTAAVSAAADAARSAQAAEDRLTGVRTQKSTAQTAAAAARDEVTRSLDRQRALLASADAAVVAAVAQEEEAARRAALAAAAATATAAGVGDATRVADAVATGPAQAAIAAARTRAGMDYVWGATGPTTFDCSGLTRWAYGEAGVSIPRTSRQQYAALPKVPLDALQPGDLVFYATGSDPSSIHHVALYLGGGRVLHAPHTGDVVREASVVMPGLYGAVRPVTS